MNREQLSNAARARSAPARLGITIGGNPGRNVFVEGMLAVDEDCRMWIIGPDDEKPLDEMLADAGLVLEEYPLQAVEGAVIGRARVFVEMV